MRPSVNSPLPRPAVLAQTLGAMGAILAPSPIFGLLSKDGLAQGLGRGASLEELWKNALPIRRAILAHPFLVGLNSGELAKESFRFYVLQDSLYLKAYARVLSLAAAKAPKEAWANTFRAHSVSALQEESALHEGLLKELGVSARILKEASMAPTNKAYASYLLATAALEPFPNVLGALLPCYWVYLEVGRALRKRGSPDPLYQRWIEAYSSGGYESVVREVIQMARETLGRVNEKEAEAFAERFMASCRYEWMFWDMAFRMETWPL
jgi:thiaminase/transcriptional activator TenA